MSQAASIRSGRKPPVKKVFLRNIEEKENDPGFSGDMEVSLGRETVYNQEAAFDLPLLAYSWRITFTFGWVYLLSL